LAENPEGRYCLEDLKVYGRIERVNVSFKETDLTGFGELNFIGSVVVLVF